MSEAVCWGGGGDLEDEAALACALEASVQGWDVHVGHQAGQRRVDKLGHKQLQRQAPLLCALGVVPAATQQEAPLGITCFVIANCSQADMSQTVTLVVQGKLLYSTSTPAGSSMCVVMNVALCCTTARHSPSQRHERLAERAASKQSQVRHATTWS